MNISDLITHIRAGTATAIMFHNALPDHAADCISAYGGSIDAAVRLCGAMLPKRRWYVSKSGYALVGPNKNEGAQGRFCKMPSRSLLIATLMVRGAGNG
jgi:hypothetical protein